MKKYFVPVIIIVLFVVCFWSYWNKKQKKIKLISNHAFTVGTVEGLRRNVRPGGMVVLYSYTVTGTDYHRKKAYPLLVTDRQSIVNKKFPVVYEMSDAENSEIVLTYKDAREYNLESDAIYTWIKELR